MHACTLVGMLDTALPVLAPPVTPPVTTSQAPASGSETHTGLPEFPAAQTLFLHLLLFRLQAKLLS